MEALRVRVVLAVAVTAALVIQIRVELLEPPTQAAVAVEVETVLLRLPVRMAARVSLS